MPIGGGAVAVLVEVDHGEVKVSKKKLNAYPCDNTRSPRRGG
jgi:hypothetical protein